MLLEQTTRRLALKAAMGELAEDHQTIDPPSIADFSSSDYLGFARSEKWNQQYLNGLQTLGRPALGYGSARVVGEGREHVALEARLAEFHGSEAALLCNSGFDANTGLWSALPFPNDLVLFDSVVHASIRVGLQRSRATGLVEWKHNSVADLRKKLGKAIESRPGFVDGSDNVFVVVDSVYSMEGDFAPLEDIVALLDERLPAGNGCLVVDETHSTGLYGHQGRGLTSHLSLERSVLIRVHTLGKAVGCNGAVILCPKYIRSYLANYSHPYIFSTALPYSTIAAIDLAYDFQLTKEHKLKVARLFDVSQYTQRALKSAGFRLIHDGIIDTPIVCVRLDEPRALAKKLRSKGFATLGVVFPACARGSERLRLSMHACNTFEQAERLVRALREVQNTQQQCEALENLVSSRL